MDPGLKFPARQIQLRGFVRDQNQQIADMNRKLQAKDSDLEDKDRTIEYLRTSFKQQQEQASSAPEQAKSARISELERMVQARDDRLRTQGAYLKSCEDQLAACSCGIPTAKRRKSSACRFAFYILQTMLIAYASLLQGGFFRQIRQTIGPSQSPLHDGISLAPTSRRADSFRSGGQHHAI